MIACLSARLSGRILTSIALAVTLASGRAQDSADTTEPINLDTLVVTALRTPVSFAQLASAASVAPASRRHCSVSLNTARPDSSSEACHTAGWSRRHNPTCTVVETASRTRIQP